MKNFLVTVFLLLTPILLVGQNTIKYSYDAAGNRTERTIILATKSAIVQSDTIFTDQLAERDIKIYPNPTDGFLKVEIGNTEGIKNCTITINAIKRDITVSGAGRFCLFFLFTTAGHKIIPRIINKQEWPALNIVSFR